MPDTPNMLRGYFYPTHLVGKCPAFKKCPVCYMCERYTPHLAQCQICESRKMPKRLCECRPETRASALKIQQVMNSPLFNPDDSARVNSVDVSGLADWGETVQNLCLDPRKGGT